MTSDPGLEVKRFIVPAPRSLVVTREGQALAENRIAKRVVARLPEIAATADEAVAWVRSLSMRLGPGIPLMKLRDEEVRRHFENRPWLPLAVTEPLSEDADRLASSRLTARCSFDVLALVSYPSFDPNVFERGITTAQYTALSEASDAPLFDRAVSGAYPPGSTFKPFVALAGMSVGKVRGAKTKFAGPGEMLIAGRYFKNWNPHGEGMMDVKYALLRSCNTWFYQVALDTGAAPITAMSQRFGLGYAPDLPLPSVAAGSIPEPETYNDPRSLANYAIGQGRVLASPVQMALAMAALANGSQVPRPRLIQGRIDARTEDLVERHAAQPARILRMRMSDIELIRDGMWRVVNYGTGTAGVARMKTPDVYGKTGTSQWSNDGKKASLAWFVVWVDAFNPRIAFAVVTHGRDGERLSGGGDAAPIASQFLRPDYAEPDLYGVTLPDAPSRNDPVITLPEPIIAEAPAPPQEVLPVEDLPVEFDLPPARRSFFDLLFGRRR
jgi:hypothetical protein